jgi:hypothetical protein
MENIFPKWDGNFKLGNPNMMQNKPLPNCAVPLKVVLSGDLTSEASGDGPSEFNSHPESGGQQSDMSGVVLSRILTPRKRKFNEVCSHEFHSFVQTKVSATKFACLGKKSRSVISLNEQLSSYERKEDELQSFSNQTHELLKSIKGDVLKDRTNTSREVINKNQEKFDQHLGLSVSAEEICFALCNKTEPIVGSQSHRIEESRAVLMQEHRVTELSGDACSSDMKQSETARRSANARYYVDATECVDANSGASYLCTKAVDYSSPLPEPVACVSGNAGEDQQCATDMQTQHCCRQAPDDLEPPLYPRPLTYGHVLTRKQYQNSIESTKGKVCLNVEDVLSSGDYFVRPELRTRSTKAESCKLKKLLQDVMSYPTVVLCRVDENVINGGMSPM